MARRFRVIQYDGPESWIVGTIDRSLPAEFPVGPNGATIMTWEIVEGDRITGRDMVGVHSEERFAEIDCDWPTETIPAVPEAYSSCAFYLNQKRGTCKLCDATVSQAKPQECKMYPPEANQTCWFDATQVSSGQCPTCRKGWRNNERPPGCIRKSVAKPPIGAKPV